MITVIPAEHGTLSFHKDGSGIYVRTVVGFSVQSKENELDVTHSVEPLDASMMLDASDWVAVYHPSTKQVSTAEGGVFGACDADEAKRFIEEKAL